MLIDTEITLAQMTLRGIQLSPLADRRADLSRAPVFSTKFLL
jgi:hypothetical protein